MPLACMNAGETRQIVRVGGTPEVRLHLENLGFVEGTLVRMISIVSGNIIVQVKDARVAISRELASKILV